MTMISERDYELLSAYLDGALNAEDTSRLEARLKSDPVLLAACQKLGQTREVLRSAPKFRVPRNFTLTPEMAGQKQRGFFNYNLMRLTSVLASVLFVIVVMGDFVGTSLFNFSQMNDLAAPQAEMFYEEMGALELDESGYEVEGESVGIELEEQPEVMAMEEPMADVGDGDNGVEEPVGAPREIDPSEPVEKTMEQGEDEPEESDTPVLEEAQPEMEGGGGLLTTPTPTSEPQPTPEPSLTPTQEPTPTMPEPTPTEERFLVQIPTEPIIDPADQQDDPTQFIRYLILAVEFGLGGIAIGAGITAFIMRKRS